VAAKETKHLSLADVLAIHDFVMQRLGHPAAPLRDEGALESAVMRPRMAEYYEGADLIRQCALLGVGISQAQAFVDGNKRTAFAALRAFTVANGVQIVAEPMEIARRLEAVAEGSSSLAEATDRFERWLRERIRPARGGLPRL
jgi:death-on-curing protein